MYVYVYANIDIYVCIPWNHLRGHTELSNKPARIDEKEYLHIYIFIYI
jgi:hypothetical protein